MFCKKASVRALLNVDGHCARARAVECGVPEAQALAMVNQNKEARRDEMLEGVMFMHEGLG